MSELPFPLDRFQQVDYDCSRRPQRSYSREEFQHYVAGPCDEDDRRGADDVAAFEARLCKALQAPVPAPPFTAAELEAQIADTPAEDPRARVAGLVFVCGAALMGLLYVGYLLALKAPMWLTLMLVVPLYAIGFVGLLALTVVGIVAGAAWAWRRRGVE